MEPHAENRKADGGAGATGGAGQTPDPNDAGLEHTLTVTLTNRYGLHMRPAKRVMEVANGFPCDVDLVANGQEVDAKSILGIIGLGAECGDEVTVRARGPQATEAAEALGELLSSLPELHGEPRDIP